MASAICNLIAIVYSICATIAVYQVVDSLVNDAHPPKCENFRGDRTYVRSTIYERLDILDEPDDAPYAFVGTSRAFAVPPTEDITKDFVYSPYKVCYVNSYKVYDSNSTMFDYTKESEYDTNDFEHILGTSYNKMYIVIDDIHMVFSLKHQQCLQYPDIIENQ